MKYLRFVPLRMLTKLIFIINNFVSLCIKINKLLKVQLKFKMKLKELLAFVVIILFVHLLVRLSSLEFDLNTIISNIKSFKDGIDGAKYKKALDFYDQLFVSEPKGRVLETILKSIGQKTEGFYVEFGASSGQTSIPRYLRQIHNWKGLPIDGTPETVLELLRKYNVPNEFDLLSEKIDNQNYLVIEKILTTYHPKVIVHRVKPESGTLCGTTSRSSAFKKSSNQLNTRNVCAFYCLAKRFGYSMVYCESTGKHCFLIRNDLLRKHLQMDPEMIQLALNPIFLYEKIGFTYSNTNWHETDC